MDRRTLLGALAVAPVAISAPALAVTQADPVTRYWAASVGYNADTITEEEYDRALDELDFWEPPTIRDFVRWYEAVYHDGAAPNTERSALVMEQAKRLLGRPDRQKRGV